MEINLLDDDRINNIRSHYRNNKLRRNCLLIIFICISLLIILGAIFAVLKISDMTLSDNLKNNEAKLSELKGDELNKNLNIQKTLSELDNLHSRKQNFSILLNYLQQLNIGTDYKNILINDNTKTTVSGIANDFSTLDKLKNALKDATVSFKISEEEFTENLFKSVEITEGVTETNKKVNFRIELEYNNNILKFGASELSLNKKGSENE